MKKRLLILLAALLCLVCALALTACEEETPEESAHTHTWGEWVQTTPATCMEKGVKTRTCECGQGETDVIPELDHPPTPSATWTGDDTHHWQTCTQTGCNGKMNKTAHDYDGENTCLCSHYKDSGVVFARRNGTYTVTDYTGTASEVIIPSKYKGGAVTSISSSAFLGCTGLTSITIPASVTSIGDQAFLGCTGLTSIAIPASVTSIGLYAFEYCTGLVSITVASGNTKYHSAGNCVIETATRRLVFGCKSSVIPMDGSVTSIGDSAFFDCTGLASVTIPASVTSIGHFAFAGCDGLVSITVESGNTKYHSAGNCVIETATRRLVFGCKSSVIPTDSSVTSIGDYAFCNCINLTSITIPGSVTSIGSSAFLGCTGLISVIFANPNGWWYASSATATSGTAILAADLSAPATAATYLKSTYCDYYWKRT